MTKSVRVGDKVRITGGTQACDDQNNYHKKGDIVKVVGTNPSYVETEGMVYYEGHDAYVDTQYVRHTHYEIVVNIDLFKPVFTIEGTPVVVVTTDNLRDAEFPVLVYEGKAGLPTKYNLQGEAKNGVARRYLTNTAPEQKEVSVVKEEVMTFIGYAYVDSKGYVFGNPVKAQKALALDVYKHMSAVKVFAVKEKA